MLRRYALPAAFLLLISTAVSVHGQQAAKDAYIHSSEYPTGFDHVARIAQRLDEAKVAVDRELDAAGLTASLSFDALAGPEVYQLLTQRSQIWDPAANGGQGDWMDENLVTYTRNDAGLATELLIQEWDAGSQEWVNSSLRTYTRDGNNNISETLDQEWDADAQDWVALQRATSELDELGRTLVSTRELWDADAGEYFVWSRSTYTYVGSTDMIETLVSESSFTGPLMPSLRYTYTYNSDGTTASRLFESYRATSEAFENAGLNQYEYDSNGERTLELELDWDAAANGGAGDWVNDYRTVIEFTPNSANPTSTVETEQSWDTATESWVNEERYLASIEGDVITETEQEWDPFLNGGQGDWLNVQQSISTMADGFPVQTITQEWDTGQGAWLNVYRDSIEVDDRGVVVSSLTEAWDGAAWVNEYLLTMTYGDFETPTAVEGEELASGYELDSSYPNPFSDATTIRFTLPGTEHVTLAVYDMLGRQVETLVDSRMTAGTHAIKMDARDLPGGMYVYRLSTDRFEGSGKMLVLR